MALRTRLALFGAGVVALALVLFGLLLYTLLARGAYTNQDDALRARAHQAVASVNASPPASQTPVAPTDLRTSTEVFVEVFDQGWNLVYSTAQPTITPRAHASGFVTQDGFRLYTTGFEGGFVVTGQSTKVPQSNASGIVVFLVISAVPALIAALLASWLVAGRALRPLQSVAATAEDIGRTRDFGRRLPSPPSRDEVARVAASFNGMLSRLQDAYESQRRFVADASHELRTPLTTIQANAGLLAAREVTTDVRHAAVSDIVDETGRMARLVERLLTLAQADSGLTLQLAPLDLAPIVEEVCRQSGAAHPDRELLVDTVATRIDGDEDSVRQLLWILLDNAFRYAASKVEVRLASDSGWARLVVADDGPGVPAPHRERVFERFYRADPSRSGANAGLGLAIAGWIAAQHGGRILAGEALAGGAAFLVDLPLLRAS